MRRLMLFLILAGYHHPVLAEEPLFLRIRPNATAQDGAGGASSQEDAAHKAWLAHEAVWERSRRNAEIAIASICTGCLSPPQPQASPATGSTERRIGAEPASRPAEVAQNFP